MTTNEDEQTYQLTPLGALHGMLDDTTARRVIERLELTARRIAKNGGIPAIAFDDAMGHFVEVSGPAPRQ